MEDEVDTAAEPTPEVPLKEQTLEEATAGAEVKPAADQPPPDPEAEAKAEEAKANAEDEKKVLEQHRIEREVEDAQMDMDGVTAAQALDLAIRRLRAEHVKLGGGSNTPHSKAITFASTARDLVAG